MHSACLWGFEETLSERGQQLCGKNFTRVYILFRQQHHEEVSDHSRFPVQDRAWHRKTRQPLFESQILNQFKCQKTLQYSVKPSLSQSQSSLKQTNEQKKCIMSLKPSLTLSLTKSLKNECKTIPEPYSKRI